LHRRLRPRPIYKEHRSDRILASCARPARNGSSGLRSAWSRIAAAPYAPGSATRPFGPRFGRAAHQIGLHEMTDVSDSGVRTRATQASILVPRAVVHWVRGSLDLVAMMLVRVGLTANAVTISSLVLACLAAVLLGAAQLGPAAIAMVIASLGDALDGCVARRTGTASMGGALLDASVDRYEEFLFLGGLAVLLRASPNALVLVLTAMVGAFMVSYGSAKAEALGVAIPPSAMRRAERAGLPLQRSRPLSCIFLADPPRTNPPWTERLSLLIALAIIAVFGNVSAVRRLRHLARIAAASSVLAGRAVSLDDKHSA
jgi:CDP-diacylglycerol---glycerol-3-phosphate 3-phosphatidyltransferase